MLILLHTGANERFVLLSFVNATFKINHKLVHCASKSTSETSIEGVQNKVELSLEMTADGSN